MIVRLLIALYLFQISGLCLLIAYYRLQASGGFLAALPTDNGLPLLGLFLLCAGALTALLVEVRQAGGRSRRSLAFALAMTTVTLLMVLLSGEALVRMAANHTAEDDYVRDTILLPAQLAESCGDSPAGLDTMVGSAWSACS